MFRRLMNRVHEDTAAVVRDQVAVLQAAIEQSWGAALEDLRRDVEVQRRALATRRHIASDSRNALAGAVERLAGALETLTALERDRREPPAHLEVLECLLREMLIGGYAPLPGPAQLVGGTIDARQLSVEAPDIDLPALEAALDDELAVGASVQVRSHFQDRWSGGFEIAEVVVDGGRRQFKLKRWYDDRPLPLLFDAADVRGQAAPPAEDELARADGRRSADVLDLPSADPLPVDQRP